MVQKTPKTVEKMPFLVLNFTNGNDDALRQRPRTGGGAGGGEQVWAQVELNLGQFGHGTEEKEAKRRGRVVVVDAVVSFDIPPMPLTVPVVPPYPTCACSPWPGPSGGRSGVLRQ
jgi:hypothetical protein